MTVDLQELEREIARFTEIPDKRFRLYFAPHRAITQEDIVRAIRRELSKEGMS